MRGISEERLRELFRGQYNPPRNEYERGFNNCLATLLAFECKELSSWLPIDADTPKDRDLLMFIPGHGKEVMRVSHIRMWSPKPTHYQELPEDPVV